MSEEIAAEAASGVAQRIEHRALIPAAVGSSPTPASIPRVPTRITRMPPVRLAPVASTMAATALVERAALAVRTSAGAAHHREYRAGALNRLQTRPQCPSAVVAPAGHRTSGRDVGGSRQGGHAESREKERRERTRARVRWNNIPGGPHRGFDRGRPKSEGVGGGLCMAAHARGPSLYHSSPKPLGVAARGAGLPFEPKAIVDACLSAW